jgi:hypothetical protein
MPAPSILRPAPVPQDESSERPSRTREEYMAQFEKIPDDEMPPVPTTLDETLDVSRISTPVHGFFTISDR